jgi:hypothetical protein
MKIEKKVWPEYFQKIIDSVKTYELRLADFECKPGDVLVLKEWAPQTKEYTGRAIERTVTYVGKTKGQTFWPKEDVEKYGFQRQIMTKILPTFSLKKNLFLGLTKSMVGNQPRKLISIANSAS